MKPEKEVFEAIRKAVVRLEGAPSIAEITAMTPDASLRRYFRVRFTSPLAKKYLTAVAMHFDAVKSPEAGGAEEVLSDEAYVQLTALFRSSGVSVPELYVDARDLAVLIIEDLGDRPLASEMDGYSDRRRRHYLEQAVDQIGRIQAIGLTAEHFVFRRSFSSSAYINEMQEFVDFIIGSTLDEEKRLSLQMYCRTIADLVSQLPTALTHRDFHAWNLMVDSSDELRVIDFQDALIAPRVYDLVSLLNDRDFDRKVGESNYRLLLKRYFSGKGSESDLEREFDLVALQRDLKVAGRFAKLSSLRGLKHYEQWIPGTLNRIGRTLSRLVSIRGIEALRPMLNCLSQSVSEVAHGAKLPNQYAGASGREGP